MPKINIKEFGKLNHYLKFAPVDQLIQILPKQTYNKETFGLNLSITNKDKWSCSYYSKLINKNNELFGITIGNTPNIAIRKMIRKFKKLGYNKLFDVI